jgi:hypothetical protein
MRSHLNEVVACDDRRSNYSLAERGGVNRDDNRRSDHSLAERGGVDGEVNRRSMQLILKDLKAVGIDAKLNQNPDQDTEPNFREEHRWTSAGR